MPFDASQQAAVSDTSSRLILGLPGSGKTRVLLKVAENLLKSGTAPESIALTTFAFRGQEVLRDMARRHTPSVAAALPFLPIKDWILPILRTGGNNAVEATNNDIRRYLRSLLVSQSFPGTLAEAEHIIRAAKARAKKLPENDPYYPLYTAFNALLKDRSLIDRHDIHRQHLLGLRNGSLPPLSVKYILVDNVQDATEVQLLWLKEHLNAGITLILAGNDDLTAFGPDGAQGPSALTTILSWPNMQAHTLAHHYRQPENLATATLKVARFLKNRSGAGGSALESAAAHNSTPGTLEVKDFITEAEEHRWVADAALRHALEGRTVGIITHSDFPANVIGHLIRKHSAAAGHAINPASYARLIWEDPTPQTVLALLSVLLNRASNTQLAMVLMGLGLPPQMVAGWLQNREDPLSAEDWLPSGAPLPGVQDASPTVVAQTAHVRRVLLQGWGALTQRITDPRTVFLSLLKTLLDVLPDHEDPYALLAADMLLSLKGDLTELLPRVTRETLPDMSAPITVAPAREARNLEFDVVIVSGAGQGHWPYQPTGTAEKPALPVDESHERRLFTLATTRSRSALILTHTGSLSPFAAELQQSLRHTQRLDSKKAG